MAYDSTLYLTGGFGASRLKRSVLLVVGLLLVACSREKAAEPTSTFFYAAAEVSRWLGAPISELAASETGISASFGQLIADFSPLANSASPWGLRSEETSGGAVLVLLHVNLEVDKLRDSIRYGQHIIYRWADGWAACQIQDKWYCFEEQASLERLLDQLNKQVAKPLTVPSSLDTAEWLLLFRGGWRLAKSAKVFSDEAWGFVAKDTIVNELLGTFTRPPVAGQLVLMEALSRLPLDALAYQISADARQSIYLRLPAAELLGRPVAADEYFPRASQQYLHIGIWEETKDRLGWGREAIYYYALIDGYLWQANELAGLQAMILRSATQAAQQVDNPALVPLLPALAQADQVMLYPFNNPQGSQQQLLVLQTGEGVAAQLLAPIASKSSGWETDLLSFPTYWQFSAYSSHWLSQSAGGEVKLGKGKAWRSFGFQSPLLAGPFTVERNNIVWQSRTALYRYAEDRLDSLPFLANFGGISFRDPQRDVYTIAAVDTSGQLRLFSSQLKAIPLLATASNEVTLVSSPAILQQQDGEGQCLVALGADQQLYGFSLQGRLYWRRPVAGLRLPERGWLRAANSLAPRENLCPSVSQNDPNRAWQLRSAPANTFLALRVGEEEVALVRSDGEMTLHRPFPGRPITELLVIEEEGKDLVLLRYGKEARAFKVVKEGGLLQLKASWQVGLPHALGSLVREEAAELWGVFYPEERKAYYYKGPQKVLEWQADFPPRYDLLEGEWLYLYESLLSSESAIN